MKNKLLTIVVLLTVAISGVILPINTRAGDGDLVVINEFVAKGIEWVELYNTTMIPIDIENWKLTDGEDDEDLSGTIDPQGYLAFDTSLTLSNDGDEIMLFDSNGILVDEVFYGTKGGAPLPPYGSSTARSPNGVDTDDFARDWNVDQTPTRGVANDGPGTNLGSSIIINEQNGYSPGGDFYELFNPTANPVDLSGWQASDGDDIEISQALSHQGIFFYLLIYLSAAEM